MDRQEQIRQIVELERRASRLLRQHPFDAWMDLSLTTAQLKSLFFIDNEGSTNFTKLATALGVTSSNMTGIIDRLVEQGLVSRKENPEDRRVLLLNVTEKGKELLTNLRERRVKQMSKVLTHMSLEELSILARGLTLLIEAAAAYGRETTADHREKTDQ
jgi:DNA-binding MarR family transcriptional regulator